MSFSFQIIYERYKPAAEHPNSLNRECGDCDCACVLSFSGDNRVGYIKSQTEALALESFHLSPELHLVALDPLYTFAFDLLTSGGKAVLGPNALDLLNAFSGGKSLAQVCQSISPTVEFTNVLDAVETLLQLGLLRLPSSKQPNRANTENMRILTAWIHITNKCNLCCSYCYVTKTPDDMDVQVGCQSVDAVIRSALSHGFQGIKLKFAGGEPTLNFRLIAELQQYAQEQTQAVGLALQSVILSNGTIIGDQIVDFLKSNCVRLMISLDGIEEYHNTQRVFADGRGSFDAVSRNIEYLIQHNIRPNISITVSNRNLAGLPQVVEYVLEHDLPFSLNLYRENACSVAFGDLCCNNQQIVEAMLAAYEVIERYLPRRSLLGSLLDRTNLSIPHTRACGVGQDYMVIDVNGCVAKCQMEIDQPVTSIYAPDPLKIVQENQIGIQNLPVDGKEDCYDCSWRYWCAGGCPLYTHRVTGRYDRRSPNCSIYKTLFPEVLRLEGLRLLRYCDSESDPLSAQDSHGPSLATETQA